MKISNRTCSICKNNKTEHLYTMNFELENGHLLPNHFDVVVCTGCGFVYSDSGVDQSVYDEYYKVNSKYEGDSLLGADLTKININRFSALVEQISNFSKQNESILDIGSAQGALLRILQGKGFPNLVL